MSFCGLSFVCFHLYYTEGEFPEMTGNPIFTGPIEDSISSRRCWQNGFKYTDFHFECSVQYPQQTTFNGARFRVSLTFDGRTSTNPATHHITDGTELTVSFPSIALKGNVGKSVNILFLSYRRLTLSFCCCIKENRHRFSPYYVFLNCTVVLLYLYVYNAF